jgi:hypothetical protein
MKIAIRFILLATLFVGCHGVSRQQSNSGEQPSTEAVESKMSQAAEVNKVEPLEPDVVFPHIKIKSVYHAGSRWVIEGYCRKRGIRQLDRDCVRLFCQPMGVVSEAIEIDLTHRQLTVYPGTHSKNAIVQTPLDERQTAEIRELVTSEEFKGIPTENKKFGLDGSSYLIEASTDNVYFWKLHWVSEDKEFMKVVDHIQSLARETNAEKDALPSADKPRR